MLCIILPVFVARLQAAAGAVAVGGIWYFCHTKGLCGVQESIDTSVPLALPGQLGSTVTFSMAAPRNGRRSLGLPWSPNSAASDLCKGI
jgi:hypothetical protein